MKFGSIFQRDNSPLGSGEQEVYMTSTKSEKSAKRSKMDLATSVYERLAEDPGVKRKDIIAEFIASCQLTTAGAATYYGIIRKRAERQNKQS